MTANAAGTIHYHWAQHPEDNEPPEEGQLTFKDAGTKTVTFTWLLQPDAIQDVLRWVMFVVDSPQYQEFSHQEFVFSCP